jgi:hypothetical protein
VPGGCRESLDNIETLVVYINQTATQINETVNKVWDQFRQTDESVVLKEDRISYVVNSTSNITINYSIEVPVKEDYPFLPIRIFYWFLDQTNTTCYNQAKDTGNAENPFCNPLVAYTIGEVNTVLNFTVDLRPSLPAGNYTVVRRIDIDPDQVWINYGHEAIGVVEVKDSTDREGLAPSLMITLGDRPKSIEETSEERTRADSSNSVTGLAAGSPFNPAAVSMAVSVITLLAVVYLVVSRKK